MKEASVQAQMEKSDGAKGGERENAAILKGGHQKRDLDLDLFDLNQPLLLQPPTALPLLGHMHPPFLAIMDEIRQGLSWLFQTRSKATCLVSGTGHAGEEEGFLFVLSFFFVFVSISHLFSLSHRHSSSHHCLPTINK
jgi:hypothetical protein